MNNLRKMYLTELKSERDSIVGHLVIIAALCLILLLLSRGGEASMISSISVVPLSLMFFWYIFYSFDILHREWKENTVSLFLSIPMKIEYLLLSKMLALLTTYLILTMAITVGMALICGISFGSLAAFIDGFLVGLSVIVHSLTLLVPLTPAVFLIYLSGVSFIQWASIVRAIVVVILFSLVYFGGRIASLVFGAAAISLDFPHTISNGSQSLSIAMASIPIYLIFTACLVGILGFFFSVRLLEERPRP